MTLLRTIKGLALDSRAVLFLGLFVFFAFNFYPVFTALISHHVLMFEFDSQRLLELVLLALIPISWLIFPRSYLQIVVELNKLHIAAKLTLVAIFTLSFLSAYFARFSHAAFAEWSLCWLLFLYAFNIKALANIQRSHFFRNVHMVLCITMLAYVVSIIHFNVIYSAQLFKLKQLVLTPYMSNPRFMQQALTWILPLLPCMAFQAKCSSHRYLRYVVYAASLVCWLLAIFSLGRGFILALGLSSIIVIILFRKAARKWLMYQVICMAVAIAMMFVHSMVIGMYEAQRFSQLKPHDYSSLDKKAKQIQDPQKAKRFKKWVNHVKRADLIKRQRAAKVTHVLQQRTVFRGGVADRLNLWQKAFSLWQSNPYLGVGPMNYSVYGKTPNTHPHNIILQHLCELGIFTTCLIWFGVLIWYLKSAKRLKALVNDTSEGELLTQQRIAYFMALTMGLIDSQVSGVFVMPISQVLAAYVIGCYMALSYVDHEIKEPRGVGYRFSYAMPAGLYVLCLLLMLPYLKASMTYLYNYRRQATMYFYKTHKKMTAKPRFWVSGSENNTYQLAEQIDVI